MRVFAALGRLIERVVTLALAAIVGGVIGGLVVPKDGEGVAIGAVVGAALVVLKWIVTSAYRGVAKRTKAAELGTIVAISSQAPPGAPWYHHTYVLIDIQGKRRKLKLTPAQAREFSEHYSEGDVGRTAASNCLTSRQRLRPIPYGRERGSTRSSRTRMARTRKGRWRSMSPKC
jgi:hypothetical protein